MSHQTIDVIYSPDRIHRVTIFRRSDESYGFYEEHFSNAEYEKCWIPTNRQTESFCSSSEIALREATGRIQWLADLTGEDGD